MNFRRMLSAMTLLSASLASHAGMTLPADCGRLAAMPYRHSPPPLPSSDTVLRAIESTHHERALAARVQGEDLNAQRGRTGTTPLAFASGLGHTEAMRWLIQQGVDTDKASRNGDTPIEYALLHAQAGAVCVLLAHNAKLPSPQDKPYLLPSAALAEDEQAGITILTMLHQAGWSLDSLHQGDTALNIAAALNHQGVAKWLLRHGADACTLNTRGESAKDIAAKAGHQALARLLGRAQAACTGKRQS